MATEDTTLLSASMVWILPLMRIRSRSKCRGVSRGFAGWAAAPNMVVLAATAALSRMNLRRDGLRCLCFSCVMEVPLLWKTD
jgi:hypothetical protein